MKKTPPWAGKSGPGYAIDSDGDLRWFASPSFMGYGKRNSSTSTSSAPGDDPKKPPGDPPTKKF